MRDKWDGYIFQSDSDEENNLIENEKRVAEYKKLDMGKVNYTLDLTLARDPQTEKLVRGSLTLALNSVWSRHHCQFGFILGLHPILI